MTAKTAKAESWRKALPRRLEGVRRTAEHRLHKAWEDAVEMLPPVPRKALKRLSADVDRARHELRKRGGRMVEEARKRAREFTAGAEKSVKKSLDPLRKRV